MNPPPAPKPRLVCVASFLSSAEGELARARLAIDDIPAWLENATVVLWYWYYSNAVGGVKVYVPEADAELAYDILHPDDETEDEERPPATCPACDAQFAADWQVCWRCGTTTDGQRDPDFFAPAPQVSFSTVCSPTVLAAVVGMIGPLLLVACGGWTPIFSFWLFSIFFVLILWAAWPKAADAVTVPDEPPDRDDSSEDADADVYEIIEESVFRLWKAAVFSFSFSLFMLLSPVVLVCTFWLLLKCGLNGIQLHAREQRRCFGILFFILLVFIFFWHVFIYPSFAQ